MAGIGFVLRRLTKRGDLTGAVEAYFHAVFASAGPWIVTILTVWAFGFVGDYWRLSEHVEEFRIIILYNFSFSLVFTAPLTMIATRYLADCFFRYDVVNISDLLVGTLSVQLLASFPIAAYFYFFFFSMDDGTAFLALINFLLISSIWLTMVFISSLKYYSVITFSFLTGMGLGLLLAYVLSGFAGSIGMLLGFNIGMAFILSSFIAVIFAEYPHLVQHPLIFLRYLKKYWTVALFGTFYNLGIWIDKWIMWFSPERRRLPNGMIIFPEYDIALFVAYLTIIPAMAMFLLKMETSFFEKFVTFYRGIQQHDSLRKIEKNHKAMMDNIMENGRNLIFLQSLICVVCLFMAPAIMEFLGMSLVQISIFRFAILGASFQILSLFLIITLSYLDDRLHILTIASVFVASNALFTWITMHLGFAFYGYGYFLSTVLTFIVSAVLTERYVSQLPYHTFVTRNLAEIT
jgi:polysaccharide biosynthesis protein PelG